MKDRKAARREAQARFKERHPDAARAHRRRYKQSVKGRAANRRYSQSLVAHARQPAASARWRTLHPEKAKAVSARWQKFHPEVKRASNARRRALKRGALIGCQKAVARIYARAQELRQWFDVVVDHKIPLTKGGAHSAENLQIIGADENAAKGACLDFVPTFVFT